RGSARFEMAQDQLQGFATVPLVDVELVGGAKQRRRRGARLDVEQHRINRASMPAWAQLELPVTRSDQTPGFQFEGVVEHRLGKALPPGPGKTKLPGQIESEIILRKFAIAQQ